MTPKELQERTLAFSLDAYRFLRPLLRDYETRYVAQQFLRCSTSVASNYRAACLARSHREWTARIGVVREEADESVFWLVFIQRAKIAAERGEVGELLDEARQLARMFGASYRTSTGRKPIRSDGLSGRRAERGRPHKEPSGAERSDGGPPQIDR